MQAVPGPAPIPTSPPTTSSPRPPTSTGKMSPLPPPLQLPPQVPPPSPAHYQPANPPSPLYSPPPQASSYSTASPNGATSTAPLSQTQSSSAASVFAVNATFPVGCDAQVTALRNALESNPTAILYKVAPANGLVTTSNITQVWIPLYLTYHRISTRRWPLYKCCHSAVFGRF